MYIRKNIQSLKDAEYNFRVIEKLLRLAGSTKIFETLNVTELLQAKTIKAKTIEADTIIVDKLIARTIIEDKNI